MKYLPNYLLLFFILLSFVGVTSGTSLYVNETGWYHTGNAFNTTTTPIQHAADNATAGDIVYVWNGSYNENVNLTQAYITLEGEGRDVVTINASNTSVSTISIWNDYINVSGFTIQNATNGTGDGAYWKVSGIFIHRGTDYCNITDNNICYNSFGIFVLGYYPDTTTYINIKRNNLYNNSNTAAYFYFSIEELNFNDNMLFNNTCSSTAVIRCSGTGYQWNRIHNNTIYDNHASNGAIKMDSSYYYISNNTIYNTTGSWEAESGIHICGPGDLKSIIEYNEIYGNGEAGIHFCVATNVTVRYNNIYNNSYMSHPDWVWNIELYNSQDITFLENTIGQVDDYYSYRLDGNGVASKATIIDEITDYNWFYLKYATPSELEVKSTTNKIIKSNTTNLTYCYPTFSNLSVNGSEIHVKVTAYNGTLTPTTTNVTISAVNSWNESAGYNITVNSSNATEICTFTVDVVNATDNYGCYVDGDLIEIIQAIDGVVTWKYTYGFSKHDLEIKWDSFSTTYNMTTSNFAGIVVVLGDVVTVFSPIVDLIISVGTIMIAIAMIVFVMGLITALFAFVKNGFGKMGK